MTSMYILSQFWQAERYNSTCIHIYCQNSDNFIANISKVCIVHVCIVHTVRILTTSWTMQLYMYGYILSEFGQFHCTYSLLIYIYIVNIYIYTWLAYMYILSEFWQQAERCNSTCICIYCQNSDNFIPNISKVCTVHVCIVQTVRILTTSWEMQLYMYGYILSEFWLFHCKYSH